MDMTKIYEFIEKSRSEEIEFLSRGIEKKSVTGSELCFQEWFREKCLEAGFDKVDCWAVDDEKIRPNVVATVCGTGGGRDLIMNGHCDVVPVGEDELEGWNTDPWKCSLIDGVLYGRGTADMKGGLTAGFFALKAIRECGVKLKGNVFFESVVGEELCHHQFGTSATVERGYSAPFAIVLEASDNSIEITAPSAAAFELKVSGKAVHASRANLLRYPQAGTLTSGPEVGVDAFRKMCRILDALDDMEKQWNFRWRDEIINNSVGAGIFTFVPGIIRAGDYLVSVPGYATVQGSYCHAPWISIEDGKNEIQAVIDSVSQRDDWLREHPPEFRILYDWPGYMTSPDHPGCAELSKAIENVTGHKAELGAFSGADDATWLCEKGIPSVTFGPASTNNNLHGKNEFMPVSQFVEATKILAAAIINWCGAEE